MQLREEEKRIGSNGLLWSEIKEAGAATDGQINYIDSSASKISNESRFWIDSPPLKQECNN
jgi:hypothetical protein